MGLGSGPVAVTVTNGSVTLINLIYSYIAQIILFITFNWSLNTLKQRFPTARMFPLGVMYTPSVGAGYIWIYFTSHLFSIIPKKFYLH